MARQRLLAVIAAIAALCLPFPLAGAEEPRSVSEVVQDPDAFHLKHVTLVGVVAGVKLLEPYFLPSGTACYGAYTFVLEEEAGNGGFLDVAVLGLCGTPLIRIPDVADGDRVTIEADIQVPSRFGNSRGIQTAPFLKGEPPAVQAIARKITRTGQ
jgi:hypothetical protein